MNNIMTEKLPSVTFKIRATNEFENDDICFMDGENPWTDVTSDEMFGNKRVLIFSLPGAFTPTCTSQQLPGFDSMFNDLKNLGIDEIYCISVNDSFVMNAWSQKLNVKNIKLIPDGTGEFTKKMGMLVNKDHLGFGMRSWRYAVIANNMNIEHLFEEPGKNDSGDDDDPYIETSPENILNKLKS